MLVALLLTLNAPASWTPGGWPPCRAACTCIAPRPTAEALRTASAVLEGTAGTQRPYGLPTQAGLSTVTRVLVEQVWKGTVNDTIFVFSGSGGGDCGFLFTSGTRYLLFLSRDPEGRWVTSICSPTSPVAEVRDRLADLGPPPARIRP
jgi:hypothetical protein